jgi:hypothetical protein
MLDDPERPAATGSGTNYLTALSARARPDSLAGNRNGSTAGASTGGVSKAGATGLEPATSGVTGDAGANTTLHRRSRKSPISRVSFGLLLDGSTAFHIALSPLQAMSPSPTTSAVYVQRLC